MILIINSLFSYLCTMKKATIHLLQSFILFGTLLFFVLFSSGLSFSLHYCDYCHQTKLFIFQHPNCCSESAHIHQSEKDCNENCCTECHHETASHNHQCGVAKHHCKTTHKFFRINAPYFGFSQPENQPICLDLFSMIAPAETSDNHITSYLPLSTNSPPTLTQAGDHEFLNFISQHLFYS